MVSDNNNMVSTVKESLYVRRCTAGLLSRYYNDRRDRLSEVDWHDFTYRD